MFNTHTIFNTLFSLNTYNQKTVTVETRNYVQYTWLICDICHVIKKNMR